VPGSPTSILLTSNPSWVGGNKHATIARVVDDFDNGVPDRVVTFALLSGTGTLSHARAASPTRAATSGPTS
jgi:hypothetical protein